MNNMRICNQNIRGLQTKSDIIFSSLIDNNCNVVTNTETWICKEHSKMEFFLDQFIVIRSDSDYASGILNRGGGSLTAVQRTQRSVRRPGSETTPEVVWVQIVCPGR